MTTTTITKPLSVGLKNEGEKLEKVLQQWGEDIRPEMKEDIYDPSYQDEEGPPPKLEYVWRNIFFMALLHLGALYGITLVPSSKIYTCLFACVLYVFTGLGITAGAHRLWSHRTYKARLPLRFFLIVANTMAFQNDVYEWARDHRAHHKFSETHADPHNSRRGFFFSHVEDTRVIYSINGSIVFSGVQGEGFHNYHHAFPYDYSTRYWIASNGRKMAVGFVNSLSKKRVESEGFHNYHHAFPYDYSTSEYRWHINFTTFFIDCMAALGLAYDRKRVSKAAVLARIKRTGDGSHKSG
ncbi:acyl-CoA desaturase 2-like protein [Cricetulus griseus]|uniref:Acyl-CoA desaturase 2-like protein n=1 Tax=Cricetulus griseus TaxID=10029 RepID=A0A061IF82_CRIGR|nr:acyl-CoA desaturase 2-like protein [Cricetulus griseus]